MLYIVTCPYITYVQLLHTYIHGLLPCRYLLQCYPATLPLPNRYACMLTWPSVFDGLGVHAYIHHAGIEQSLKWRGRLLLTCQVCQASIVPQQL